MQIGCEETEFVEDTQKDKYLTFRLGEENYGLEIRHVLEIIGIQQITQVPDMPSFIQGVINLRGQVIPVMDMRRRFQMQAREQDDRTCIIVSRIGEQTIGLLVDRVSEVVAIPASQIELPSSSLKVQSQTVKGIGKIGDEIRILLETDHLLAS